MIWAQIQRFPSSARDAFLLGTGAGCVFGLLVVALLARVTGVDDAFGGGMHDGYLELARSLVRGDGFVFEPGGAPVFHRPPLYPLALVPIALLPEVLQRPVLTIAHALLLGATAGITFRMAAHAFGVPIARNAVRLLLLNPWLYWMTTVPMCVLLQVALCAGLMFLLFVRRGGIAAASAATACATGAVAAALALTHAAMLLSVAMLFAGVVLLERRRGAAGLRRIGIAAAVALVGIAPWTARNWAVFDRFVPVAANAGFAYFVGSAHWGHGELSGRVLPENVYGAEAGREGLYIAGVAGSYDEVTHFFGVRDPAVNDRLDALMVEHVLDDVPRFATKLMLNGLEFYLPVVFPLLRGSAPSALERIYAAPGKLVRSAFYAGVWLLAVVALLSPPAGRGRELAWVVLGVAAFALPYFPFLTFGAHSSYNLGTMPSLSIAAAVGLRRVAATARKALCPRAAAVVPPSGGTAALGDSPARRR